MERYVDQENHTLCTEVSVSQSMVPMSVHDCNIDLHELEREIKELEDKKRGVKSVEMLSNVRQKLLNDLSKHSQHISNLRNKANSRFKTEYEEPDIYAMGVLQRNSYWDKRKQKKIEDSRKAQAVREMNKCTFKPNIARCRQLDFYRSAADTSYSSLGNRKNSYSELHRNKVMYKATKLNRSFSNIRSYRTRKN